MRRLAWVCLLAMACGGDDGGPANGSTSAGAQSTGPQGTGPTTGLPTEGTGSTSGPTTNGLESSGSPGSTDGSSSGGPPGADYGERGPYGVGLRTIDVQRDERTLHVTLWFPAAPSDATTPLASLYDGEDGQALADLMEAAPADCVRPEANATLDAELVEGTYPAVVFSHCLSCLGVSSSFVAERLASHGIIVAGVTHDGDTLFEQQQGNTAPLNAEWLDVRAADVSAVLDALLAGSFDGSFAGSFADAIDPERLGVFGHSYGATTTGAALQRDDRFIAGVAMAAPIENPLLPGVSAAEIDEPMLFVLAEEDNSIQAVGNNLMRTNAAAMPGGSWLVEVADAGHWSVSDLCGIIEEFAPGCGEGTRQSTGEPFTYLDPALGRDITASYVAAFFGLHLLDDDTARDALDTATPADVVTVTRHDGGR